MADPSLQPARRWPLHVRYAYLEGRPPEAISQPIRKGLAGEISSRNGLGGPRPSNGFRIPTRWRAPLPRGRCCETLFPCRLSADVRMTNRGIVGAIGAN